MQDLNSLKRIEPSPLALEGVFLNTGTPGKSVDRFLKKLVTEETREIKGWLEDSGN